MSDEPDFSVSPAYEQYLRKRRASWRRFNLIAGSIVLVLLAIVIRAVVALLT